MENVLGSRDWRLGARGSLDRGASVRVRSCENLSELVVLGSAEFFVRDEAALILVLVLEDLLDELVVVGQHLFHLVVLAGAGLLCLLHLFLQVITQLTTTTEQTIRC